MRKPNFPHSISAWKTLENVRLNYRFVTNSAPDLPFFKPWGFLTFSVTFQHLKSLKNRYFWSLIIQKGERSEHSKSYSERLCWVHRSKLRWKATEEYCRIGPYHTSKSRLESRTERHFLVGELLGMCVLLALIFCYGSITMCALLDGAELQLGTVCSTF